MKNRYQQSPCHTALHSVTRALLFADLNHVVLFFPPIFFLWGRWKTAVFAGRSRWWSDLWCNYGATRAAIWFGKVFASRNLVVFLFNRKLRF